MKKVYILIIALVATTFQLSAQQELSLLFMQELGQSKRLNPAVNHPYNVHVGLPSLGLNYHNAAFSFNELFTQEEGVWQLRPEGVLNGLDADRNDIRLSSNVETFSVGFNIDKFQFHIFHNANVDATLMFPSALLNVIWHGNTYYLDETVNIAPAIDLMSYHEFGVGVSFDLIEGLRVGATLKYLQGMVALNSENSILNLHTDSQYYALSVSSDVYFRSSGFASDFYKSSNEDIFPSRSGVTFLFNSNRGVGLDLGAVYALNEKVNLSFSAVDIGAILWKSNVFNHRSNGSYEFNGVDVNPFRSDADVDLEEMVDSLESNLELVAGDEIFTTFLTPKFYFSGTYDLGKGLIAGGLFYSDINKGRFNPAMALSLRKRLGRTLSLGTMVGMHARSRPNVGFNGTLSLGPVQLYFVSDNLPALISVTGGKNTNIRLGMNLAFATKTEEEKAMETIQNDTAPQGDQLDEKNSVPRFYNPWISSSQKRE